jgi:hypothetical protein
MVVGHVAPEAYEGGLIGLIHEGDSITIDAHQRLLQLNVADAQVAARRAVWEATRAPLYEGRAREVRPTGGARELRCSDRQDLADLARTSRSGEGRPVLATRDAAARLWIW